MAGLPTATAATTAATAIITALTTIAPTAATNTTPSALAGHLIILALIFKRQKHIGKSSKC